MLVFNACSERGDGVFEGDDVIQQENLYDIKVVEVDRPEVKPLVLSIAKVLKT